MVLPKPVCVQDNVGPKLYLWFLSISQNCITGKNVKGKKYSEGKKIPTLSLLAVDKFTFYENRRGFCHPILFYELNKV